MPNSHLAAACLNLGEASLRALEALTGVALEEPFPVEALLPVPAVGAPPGTSCRLRDCTLLKYKFCAFQVGEHTTVAGSAGKAWYSTQG